MRIVYDRLWELLLSKKISKTDLCNLTGISSRTMAKLSKNESVTTDTLLRICEALDAIDDCEFAKKELTVYIAKGNVSKAVGQNRKNKKKLCEKYNLYRIKVLEKNDISGYNISINIK